MTIAVEVDEVAATAAVRDNPRAALPPSADFDRVLKQRYGADPGEPVVDAEYDPFHVSGALLQTEHLLFYRVHRRHISVLALLPGRAQRIPVSRV